MADLNDAMLGTMGNTDDGRELYKDLPIKMDLGQQKGW